MTTRIPMFAAAVATLFAVVACGGGGGGSASSAPPVVNASPGGIWVGTDSLTGMQITGIVDEAGEAHFIRADGTQYVGTVVTNGNSFTASFQGMTQFGSTFPDGSIHGTGVMTGAVQERQSISATDTFTTDAGTTTNGSLTLNFNSMYDLPSSLATISGNYTDTASGAVMSISASGAITSQDPTTGCVLNGQVTIIDPTYNAYAISVSISSCTGTAAAVNGATFTGLGAINNSVAPEQLVTGVSGPYGGNTYAFVNILNRT